MPSNTTWVADVSFFTSAAYLGCLLMIVVLGAAGNLMICITITLDKKLQTITNYFLFSLSMADLLISVFVLPARYFTQTIKLDSSTFYLCPIYAGADDYLKGVSTFHICSISLERYSAIKNPLSRSKPTRGRLIGRVLLVWLSSFIIFLPLYVTVVLFGPYPESPDYCSAEFALLKYFKVVVATEVLIIYFMVAVVGYTTIGTVSVLSRLAWEQKKSKVGSRMGMVRNVPAGNSNKNSSRPQVQESEKKALKVVWILSFVFIIDLLPYGFVNTLFLIFPSLQLPTVMYTVSTYLTYCNSVINPIVYTIFNRRFRKNFKNILLMRFKE
ncbi:octopamine receptor beta-2R-like [Euwallacea fornicatus]|uniref:octopamine receptor beta-2R-like n=1 Tax=Euwallacea fornicatus TaxID=995702 RepID=UPI00338FAD27